MWPRAEPELRSLNEWLDSEAQQYGGKRAVITVCTVTISYFLATMIAVILLKANHVKLHDAPGMLIWPMAVATLISSVTGFWYYRSQSIEEREHRKLVGEAQSFAGQLQSARWMGGIKAKLGEPAALALNEAAYDFLRCKMALKSPAWRGLSSDSAWAAARDKADMAMEAAMARLLTMIVQGGSPERPEVQRLLSDMHHTADEISATAEKLAIRKGISGDVSQDLRRVLSEMRALNDAHDEVTNLEILP